MYKRPTASRRVALKMSEIYLVGRRVPSWDDIKHDLRASGSRYSYTYIGTPLNAWTLSGRKCSPVIFLRPFINRVAETRISYRGDFPAGESSEIKEERDRATMTRSDKESTQ